MNKPENIFKTQNLLSHGTLAFRRRRHCSHLYSYLRRALPATCPHGIGNSNFKKYTISVTKQEIVEKLKSLIPRGLCSDFPPREITGDYV